MSRKFEKLFGIGLPKTGTTTLGHCFEVLGYSKAPYDIQLIEEVAEGSCNRIPEYTQQWEAFEDWPWPVLYKNLSELYPNAGFILTVRQSKEAWLKSLQKHTNRNPNARSKRLRKLLYKSEDPWKDEQHYRDFYQHHTAAVQEHFAGRENFLTLCWEDGSGWEEICSFTGDDIPKVPIPHMNNSQQLTAKSLLKKKWLPDLKQAIKRLAK